MKCIKWILFTFLISLLILPLSSHAQESELNHSLQPGVKALQFQIADDFNLESFSGSVISYKWLQSSSEGYRMGVSFNGSYNSQDSETIDGDDNDSNFDINLAVNFSWMEYVNPRDDVKFYYGYGPEVRVGYDRTESDDSDFGNDVVKGTLAGVGALGYAGVEWFFQQSMSIHAEYQASARFSYIKQKRQSPDLANTRRAFRVGGDGVQFGISVYF